MNRTAFCFLLVLVASHCNPKGKQGGGAGGGGGGGGGGDGGYDTGNANQVQNGPGQQVGGGMSDSPTVAQPNAAGGGTFSSAGGQSSGQPPNRPQFENIANPNPNVSSPQGCTMQRQTAAPSASGLRLDEAAVAQLPSVPPTVSVEFKRKTLDPQSGQMRDSTSRCAGVLSLRQYRDVPLDYSDFGYEATKKVANISFPRISLATHCLRTAELGKISAIVLRSTTDPTRKFEINLDAPNTLFSSTVVSGVRLYNINEFKKSTTQDEKCTQETVRTGDKLRPCFTLGEDALDLISDREQKFIDQYFFKNSPKPFTAKDYYRTEGNWLKSFPAPAADGLDWEREFAEGSARNMTTLSVDDRNQFSANVQSQEDLMKFLNANLINIKATRLVRKGQTMLPFDIPRPPEGWGGTLVVYGDSKSVEAGGRGSKNVFVVSAIGLTGPAMEKFHVKPGDSGELRQGDSGARLIGEFLEVTPPFLTVRSYRKVLGVLSTVGGKDVCAGDDLLCCDRS